MRHPDKQNAHGRITAIRLLLHPNRTYPGILPAASLRTTRCGWVSRCDLRSKPGVVRPAAAGPVPSTVDGYRANPQTGRPQLFFRYPLRHGNSAPAPCRASTSSSSSISQHATSSSSTRITGTRSPNSTASLPSPASTSTDSTCASLLPAIARTSASTRSHDPQVALVITVTVTMSGTLAKEHPLPDGHLDTPPPFTSRRT